MFDTVLVADRGLLACRVVRTCQRLGARAVTVHAEGEAGRLHSRCADESVLLGPADPAASYLDGLKVIEAGRQAGAQAVHPGGGPLAASAPFAQAVLDAGLAWVGPPPAFLDALQPAGDEGVAVTVLGLASGEVVALGDSGRTPGGFRVPAALPDDARAAARATAVEAAQAAGLRGLATVVVDAGTPALATGWLAVEHPAVEVVTGVDLVEQQLLVAAGAPPSYAGADELPGVALLVALRARTSGRLTRWQLPDGEGVRVDVGFRKGERVSPAVGPLATLTAWGRDEPEAQARLDAARKELDIDGIELDDEGMHA